MEETVSYSEKFEDNDGVEKTVRVEADLTITNESHPYGMGSAVETLAEIKEDSYRYSVDGCSTEAKDISKEFPEFGEEEFLDNLHNQ